jgi:hypothetical protein
MKSANTLDRALRPTAVGGARGMGFANRVMCQGVRHSADAPR